MSNKFVVEGGLSIPQGKNLELAGYDVGAVSNDATLNGASQSDLVTEYAVKSYIDNKNQFEISDGTTTSTIDVDETLTFSTDAASTITVSENAIAFSVDVDGSSVEINETNGLQVKASGITNAMLNGSIANDKLSNSTMSFGGVQVSLGGADATPAFDLSDATAYVGDSSLITTGTITTGTWQGTAIAKAYIGADAIDGSKIGDDSIDSEHIADGSIDLAHMSVNSIDSDQYVDGSIDTAHYAAGSVDTTALGADAVNGDKLADDAVDSEHITDGSIDLVHMSVNSVDSDQYVDGSIDSVHIASGTIANDRMVNDSVTITAGSGLSGGGEVDLGSTVSLALDLSEATAGDITNSTDSFLFVDADDNSTKQESIADLVAGMDGTGLTATSGSLSVDSSQAQITSIGTSGVNLDLAGSVSVNGDVDMNSNDLNEVNSINGSSDEMIISADGDEASASASATNSLSLNASGGIFTNDLVSMKAGYVSTHTKKLDFTASPAGTATTCFTFTDSEYGSAKIVCKIVNGSNVTAKEVLVVSSGGSTSLVEYGTVSVGTEVGMTWSATTAGGTTTVKCDATGTLKGSFELIA